MGTHAADGNCRTRCRDKLLGAVAGRDGINRAIYLRGDIAIDLGDIEDVGSTRHEAAAGIVVAVRCGLFGLGRGHVLVEDDERGFLALADLGSLGQPLAIGAPQAGGEVLAMG